MATRFGWKRKLGSENLSKKKPKLFSEEEEEDEEPYELDWGLMRPKLETALEDPASKSDRLVKEGVILAEEERYWEAVLRWDSALELTPNNEKIYEMKAQSLLELHEIFPAVQAAERAVSLNPVWPEAHQTLGRAQLALGEIEMAISSFSKAVHLTPDNVEMWVEDLLWAKQLQKQKHELEKAESEQSYTTECEKG